MYIFRIKKDNFYHPEVGSYFSYSVEVFIENKTDRLCYIPDVFADVKKAQEFADICNQYQPEPVHLEELCIDFLQQ